MFLDQTVIFSQTRDKDADCAAPGDIDGGHSNARHGADQTASFSCYV